ncbi:hypothetical protein DKZ29_00930 [Limosilactobacillus reuteri]|uniref:Uncharacterized protein n=1 Tax=Limosilactobacillus reuteri TaxID=1598 RepID=A0A855XX00_LIMRT|nr:hypothetical protein [Limosilactobacillus reuteri]PWT33250.1 hypothetical protein DKZ21_04005 [Limosilactobacillus reuteri]PWT36098.1 hypothetical protein DKZ24_00430 [Limosilactobacillus reuteri]PWT43145.1 hypothetical protein DKZ22_02015 [Limosilactobacillus reuteri]PWT44784.1 hypothetical protein DKZ25_04005 [Limosilactobacillus reuteri]PWT55983.1 hypothetical protein DKZ31_00430 [Limosilactobacillus reuteri]
MYYYLYDPETKKYLGCQWSDVPVENAIVKSPYEKAQVFKLNESGDDWVPVKLTKNQQEIAMLQTMTMQQNQANAKLQATNQQQATQIKQLQQMVMVANQQQAVEKSKGANA